jgi:FtsH-binding integral membrane protein
MWQKPAKTILEVHDAIRNAMAFIFFCAFSGALGFLLQECISKKSDWAEKVSFGFLAVSMSVFYGLHIYGMLATESFRSHRLMCGIKLLFCLVSFLVGFLIVGRT